MNFFRYLRAALRFARSTHFTPEAEDTGFWSAEDAAWLQKMLDSYQGRKLQVRLANYAIKMARDAVKRKTNTSYEAGEASGIDLGIAAIYAHLPNISPVQSASEQSESERAGDTLSELETQPVS